MSNWYRNGKRTGHSRYHKARADWIRSGRARCGADIRHPTYVSTDADVEHTAAFGCGPCARCKALAGRAS